MFRKLLFIFLVAIACREGFAAEGPGLFTTANQAYQSGNYQAAVEDYEKVLSAGNYSAEAYYNLGSAYQMLKQPVQAVLNYRRALMLNPTLLQARINLDAIAKSDDIPIPPYTWREEVSSVVLPTWLIYGGTLMAWIGIFFLIYGFFKKGPRFWWISISIVLFLGGKSLAVVGYVCDPKVAYSHSAIITGAQAVSAQEAPAESSASVEKLLPGTGVNVLSKRGAWSYCLLEDHTTAWLPTKNITMVIPAASH